MSYTQLADPFVDVFSGLSIDTPSPFNPVHSIHQLSSSIAIPKAQVFTQPISVQQLTLELLTEGTYKIELNLDTASIRRTIHGRRKFIRDIEQMLKSTTNLTELNVTVNVAGTLDEKMIDTCLTVTDLFWTTINASIFYRESLTRYTATMEDWLYVATTGDEVRALVEDLTFMVIY